jgi:hypothetical protein
VADQDAKTSSAYRVSRRVCLPAASGFFFNPFFRQPSYRTMSVIAADLIHSIAIA